MREDTPGAYRLGLLLVTASAVAWSTTGLFTRIIALDAWTMLVWRGLFGAAGMLAVIVAMRGGNSLRDFAGIGRPGMVFAGVSGIGMLFFITSLRHTTVAHVAIIYATVPFVAAGLAWLALGERPSRAALTASLVALAGVTAMVGLASEGSLFGDLLAFGMTASMAVMMVISRAYPGIPIMPAACLSALLSAIAAMPFGTLMLGSTDELFMLALFGLVNSALGLSLFTLGARLLPAIETALIGSLDAPLAPLLVWIFVGERPLATTVVGGIVVFAAVAGHILAGSAARQRRSS